jgi:hypothetical protein
MLLLLIFLRFLSLSLSLNPFLNYKWQKRFIKEITCFKAYGHVCLKQNCAFLLLLLLNKEGL